MRFFLIFVFTVLISVFDVVALEVTAKPRAQEFQSGSAASYSKALLDELKRIRTCNVKKMFYAPDDVGSDGDGCVAVAFDPVANGQAPCEAAAFADFEHYCSLTSGCKRRQYDPERRRTNFIDLPPAPWKHGSSFAVKTVSSSNNFIFVQCFDGVVHYENSGT